MTARSKKIFVWIVIGSVIVAFIAVDLAYYILGS
jgi:hypothetical protein